MAQVFMVDGFYCLVDKIHEESMERFIDRGYFVVNQKPQTDAAMNDAILMSRIWANIKYDKCQYSKEIHKEIEKLSSFTRI